MDDRTNRLAYWLIKDVNRAIRDYSMIQTGDRVAVALSGGKDSLTMLRLLDLRRQHSRDTYDLVTITVLADSTGPADHAHAPLVEWLEANQYSHVEIRPELPVGEKLPLDCHRCTWNRRRTLFQTAHLLGCNVIAMGHHADDLAQTTLLNLIYHGQVETMLPRREYFDGLLRLVRPLCYLPEDEIRRFSRSASFPPAPPDCPQSEHSRRSFVAGLLGEMQRDCRAARTNLMRAGLKSTD